MFRSFELGKFSQERSYIFFNFGQTPQLYSFKIVSKIALWKRICGFSFSCLQADASNTYSGGDLVEGHKVHVPRLLLQRQIIKHKEKRYKKNNVRQNLLNRYKIKNTLKKTASYSSNYCDKWFCNIRSLFLRYWTKLQQIVKVKKHDCDRKVFINLVWVCLLQVLRTFYSATVCCTV